MERKSASNNIGTIPEVLNAVQVGNMPSLGRTSSARISSMTVCHISSVTADAGSYFPLSRASLSFLTSRMSTAVAILPDLVDRPAKSYWYLSAGGFVSSDAAEALERQY